MAQKPEQIAWDDSETKPIGNRAKASGDDKLPPKHSKRGSWQKSSSKKIGLTDRISPKYRD